MSNPQRSMGREKWAAYWRATRNFRKREGWRDIVENYWRKDSPCRMVLESQYRICPPIRAVDAAKLWEECRDMGVRNWRKSRVQRAERREAVRYRIAENLRYDRVVLGVDR